jgi:hypothetical protein
MATIITKNSQTASAVPSAASLEVGELAVNTADGKLYTEHTGGVVKQVGGNTQTISAGTGISVTNPSSTNPTITNTGVTSVAAGTGISVSASTGGVTISASGGVTSLNGQTGAITDTAYGAIGSYVIAASTTAVGAAGNTVAGSTLNYQNHPTAIMNMGYINYYEGQNLAGNIWTDSTSCGLSGTWRAMTKTVSSNRFGLYVRVS